MSTSGPKPSLRLERKIAAPPADVFAAWTKAEILCRWFGPDQAEVLSADIDARLDGRFHVIFRTPDGETHDVRGTYLEVVSGRRLVFTWQWLTLPERRSLVTVTIDPADAGSHLILLHEQFFDEPARNRHIFGWNGALDKLHLLAEKRVTA